MKIAFISFEYPPFMIRGSTTFTVNITRELARQNNEIHVITPRLKGYDKFEIIDGVFIHRIYFINKPLMRAPSFWLSLLSEFRKIEKAAGKFDIIHANGTSDFSLYKRYTGNTPRVVSVHHLATDVIQTMKVPLFSRIKDIGGETGLLPFIEKISINRADKLITESKYTKGKLESILHVPPSKIEMIYLGWEEKQINFSQKEKDELRGSYDIDRDKPVLLFVGRIDEERKGLHTLLKAFSIASDKINAQLIVVGSGNQSTINKYLPSLGLDGKVTLTGFVKEDILQKLYAICDVYVCPSRLEGFGLTILDAMAAGKPVIATRVGAIPEIISKGENGILVPVNDENALADAIIQILGNTTKAKAVGETNRKKVLAQYKWDITTKQLVNTYMQLLKS